MIARGAKLTLIDNLIVLQALIHGMILKLAKVILKLSTILFLKLVGKI